MKPDAAGGGLDYAHRITGGLSAFALGWQEFGVSSGILDRRDSVVDSLLKWLRTGLEIHTHELGLAAERAVERRLGRVRLGQDAVDSNGVVAVPVRAVDSLSQSSISRGVGLRRGFFAVGPRHSYRVIEPPDVRQ